MAIFSCKSSKESTASASSDSEAVNVQSEPQMLASINRTACYGKCPMYKATFFDNGEVEYIGRRFVENIGTYQTLISEEEVLQIKKNITEYDYFSLDSLYPTPVTDFPSCITEANLNGQRKRVINRRSPPPNLKAFEKFLDSLLENREWEKVSDNTDYYKKTQ
jgi:hypothetical protein